MRNEKVAKGKFECFFSHLFALYFFVRTIGETFLTNPSPPPTMFSFPKLTRCTDCCPLFIRGCFSRPAGPPAAAAAAEPPPAAAATAATAAVSRVVGTGHAAVRATIIGVEAEGLQSHIALFIVACTAKTTFISSVAAIVKIIASSALSALPSAAPRPLPEDDDEDDMVINSK